MNRHIYCKSTTKMCYFILDPIVINESIGKCVFLTMWCLGGRMRDSIFGVREKKMNCSYWKLVVVIASLLYLCRIRRVETVKSVETVQLGIVILRH